MVTETSALVERHNIHTQNKTEEEVPAQNVELSAVCKQNHFFYSFAIHSVILALGLLSLELLSLSAQFRPFTQLALLNG